MTTLIIHPDIEIQKKKVSELIERLLGKKNKENNPDIHIIDGVGKSSIGIEDVKKLLHQLQFQPYSSIAQVGVIINCDILTQEAQNSLLKALEEPGFQTEFILTVCYEKNLLPTLLSRSFKIFVDKDLNIKTQVHILDISKFIRLGLVEKFLVIEDLVDKDKTEPGTVHNFLIQLTQAYRNILIKHINKKDKNKAAVISFDLKEISKAAKYISKNTNKRFTLENLILQIEHRII